MVCVKYVVVHARQEPQAVLRGPAREHARCRQVANEPVRARIHVHVVPQHAQGAECMHITPIPVALKRFPQDEAVTSNVATEAVGNARLQKPEHVLSRVDGEAPPEKPHDVYIKAPSEPRVHKEKL